MELNRQTALELMESWTTSESLRKHMLSVEAAMVAYAQKYGEDETKWAVTGLLHDFDYEQHPDIGPDGHPFVGVAHLRELGYPDDVLDAILGHADFSGVARESLMAKVLYASDEITGLITAAVLVRPDKNIANQKIKSLKKKFKDKAFARGVNREDVTRGAEELGVDLWEHISFVLEAMQNNAELLELDGRLAA